jgi:hypothetical protein
MAWLNGANLEGADLRDAKFQCADFGRANMFWIELPDFMWGTDKGHHVDVGTLKGAQLKGADLEGVRLEGANLSGVRGLTQEQLDKSCVSERTSLPDGLTRPKPCTQPLENVIPEALKLTSYSTWGIGSLQAAAIAVSDLLKSFADSTDKTLQSFIETRSNADTKSMTEVEKENDRKRAFERSSRFMEEQIATYDKQFKNIAVQLRNEMIFRLSLEQQEAIDEALFNFPTNPLGMKKVANTLEGLADKLCSIQQKRSKTVGIPPMVTS